VDVSEVGRSISRLGLQPASMVFIDYGVDDPERRRELAFDELLIDGRPLREILSSESQHANAAAGHASAEWVPAPITPLRHDQPGCAASTLRQWLGEADATFPDGRTLVLAETDDLYHHGITCRVTFDGSIVRWDDFANEAFQWHFLPKQPDLEGTERFQPSPHFDFDRDEYEQQLREALARYVQAGRGPDQWWDGSTSNPQSDQAQA
jgi:hypothetical protein